MPLPIRSALAALAVLALACASPAFADDSAKKKPAAAPAPAADAPIYDPDLIGEKAIAAAQKVASESGRRLLLNFGTNDCGPCAVFNRALHKNGFFEVFSHDFVAEYIDVGNMPNAALIDRYFINPKAELPAIVILMPDGRLIEALAHGEMAAIAKKGGEAAVQEWFLKRLAKSAQ